MFTRNNTPVKIALYGLMLIIFYLLTSVPALGLRFMGQAPELLFILTICVAFNESETFSAFFALAAGILNDCVTDSVVGKSAIVFMFTAFLVSVSLKTILRRLFLTYVVLSLTTVLLFLVTEYIFTVIFYGGLPFGQALLKVILPKFLYSGVLCYPVYFIVGFLSKKLDAGGGNV